MRVLTLTNMYPSDADSVYGVFVAEQVAALQRHGLDIDVLHFEGRAHPLRYAQAVAELRRRVRKKRYDVVHAHYGLTGLVAIAQSRVPVVTTFHGTDALGPAWQRAASRWVARRSTAIVVTSEMGEALGIADPLVVPCAVDLEQFRPMDRDAARDELGWPRTAPTILFPASPGKPVKNFALFERAIEEVRRRIPEVQAVTLDRFHRRLVPTVLNAADVVLVTSLREGSPVVVREALACLTPVVATPVGDLPGLLRGLPGCSTVEPSPTGLATAVLDALGKPRSDALREHVLPYAAEAIARRISAIYDAVVTGSSARSDR